MYKLSSKILCLLRIHKYNIISTEISKSKIIINYKCKNCNKYKIKTIYKLMMKGDK